MTASEKIKTAKTSVLSWRNVSKFEFLTSEGVLIEEVLLEKNTRMKRFGYSSLGKELKEQTDISKKQYQKLANTYEFDEIYEFDKIINTYELMSLIKYLWVW